ncbi:helix-turn-helix domain-containing protein [Acidovorax sp. NPDC077693]|uniref:helix-turn-helix domain-containing protein n=1 Tax=unclassified Acidovorax TaxID=2684926 RepID=UPI0037C9BCEA
MPSRNRATPKADFGRVLRELRAARGLVQEDMLTATSRRHTTRMEQGHQVPSLQKIESLAEHLQVHPLTLVAAAYCADLSTAALD